MEVWCRLLDSDCDLDMCCDHGANLMLELLSVCVDMPGACFSFVLVG